MSPTLSIYRRWRPRLYARKLGIQCVLIVSTHRARCIGLSNDSVFVLTAERLPRTLLTGNLESNPPVISRNFSERTSPDADFYLLLPPPVVATPSRLSADRVPVDRLAGTRENSPRRISVKRYFLRGSVEKYVTRDGKRAKGRSWEEATERAGPKNARDREGR